MEYKKLEAKSAMNHIKGSRLPYEWDLNIYRGCGHGCKYCFALYSHKYLNDTNYFNTVYYKENILQCLEKELSSPKWERKIVNIGGITDSYQPIEKQMKLMPEILKLMIKYKTPIIISTKSKLILRDIELIKELAKITFVNIACTITTADEEIRKKLEPGGSSSIERFKVLNEIKKQTKATVGVHLMPIVPYLTDDYNSLKAIYRTAKKINADYVLPSSINLRGPTRDCFLSFLKNYDINKYYKFTNMFYNKELKKEYKKELYKKIGDLEKEYGLSRNYMKAIKNHYNN